jgi:hypothetical protein
MDGSCEDVEFLHNWRPLKQGPASLAEPGLLGKTVTGLQLSPPRKGGPITHNAMFHNSLFYFKDVK